MAFTYDLTSKDQTYQYSPAWFAVFIRYRTPLSFDRANAVQKNQNGESVSTIISSFDRKRSANNF